MRQFCKCLVFFVADGVLLGTCAFSATAKESQVTEKASPTNSEEEVNRLIDQLGSERFTVREQATQELSKLGKSALPGLKEAAKSRDAEVRRRAHQLIERMEQPPVRPIDNFPEQPAPAVKSYL